MDSNVTLDTRTLENMLGELIQSIETLDLSIDFLSAIMSGGEAAMISARQAGYGRAGMAPELASMGPVAVAESQRIKSAYRGKIRQIINEESIRLLREKK
jgi:hypothetical protein